MAGSRALRAETPEQSKAMLLGVLSNQPGAPRDIVILNAGAALYVANVVNSMKEGVVQAQAAIESGAAKLKLKQLVYFSCSVASA